MGFQEWKARRAAEKRVRYSREQRAILVQRRNAILQKRDNALKDGLRELLRREDELIEEGRERAKLLKERGRTPSDLEKDVRLRALARDISWNRKEQAAVRTRVNGIYEKQVGALNATINAHETIIAAADMPKVDAERLAIDAKLAQEDLEEVAALSSAAHESLGTESEPGEDVQDILAEMDARKEADTAADEEDGLKAILPAEPAPKQQEPAKVEPKELESAS